MLISQTGILIFKVSEDHEEMVEVYLVDEVDEVHETQDLNFYQMEVQVDYMSLLDKDQVV